MTLPVVSVILPTDLRDALNGQLPPGVLVEVASPHGAVDRLHHLAARAWAALTAAAAADGLTFGFTDCYRPIGDQERLFLDRYSPSRINGRPTKSWRGQTWWLKPGVATAATPGTSNHGLGLALDVAEVHDGTLVSITADGVAWLCAHAATFGFSAELESEPWHWRYVSGDRLPAAVTPPPLPQEDDTMYRLYSPTGFYDTLAVGPGVPFHLPSPTSAQELVDKVGVIDPTTGARAAKGTAYAVLVTEISEATWTAMAGHGPGTRR